MNSSVYRGLEYNSGNKAFAHSLITVILLRDMHCHFLHHAEGGTERSRSSGMADYHQFQL